MEIQGKVIQILPLQQGVGSSGKPWASQSFIIETPDQYPRKVCIELFGEDRVKNNPVNIDDNVTVSYDLESREFNGRWYTSVRAWKVEKLDGAQTQDAAEGFPAVDPFAQPQNGGLFGQLPGEAPVGTDPFTQPLR